MAFFLKHFFVFDYTALGKNWHGTKYSHGVWKQFARTFEKYFFATIEKCQLFLYELILELFSRSWSPNFPIQFSEIRSSAQAHVQSSCMLYHRVLECVVTFFTDVACWVTCHWVVRLSTPEVIGIICVLGTAVLSGSLHCQSHQK